MKTNKSVLLIFLVFGLLVLPFLAQSRMTFYSFEIIVPDEVNANPGDTVVVDGEILVTGMYWLHMFDMTVEGLPYDYEIEPDWEEHVRILREWNPEQGVYRVPETFKMTIDIPEDAIGAHLVTITGQEHHSFREISNETYFVLAIGGAPTQVNLSVSDILVPEMIDEYEPFNLTFKIDNEGALDIAATISVLMPEEWQVDESSQTMQIEGDSSVLGTFEIIPTTTAGEVSILVEYPFKGEIVNFTKAGPYIEPGAEVTPESKPFYAPLSELVGQMVKMFESIGGDYTIPIIIGTIMVLLMVIFWILSGMFKFVRAKGAAEPETMEQVETTGVQIKEV